MARPRKDGLEYFPHDCDALDDEKLQAMISEYGAIGYGTFFALLERIYRSKNLELELSQPYVVTTLARKLQLTSGELVHVIETAVTIGLFDKRAYESRSVLTSQAIRKRAEPVFTKRKQMRKVSDSEFVTETSQSIEEKRIDDHSTQEQKTINQNKKKEKGTGDNSTSPFNIRRLFDGQAPVPIEAPNRVLSATRDEQRAAIQAVCMRIEDAKHKYNLDDVSLNNGEFTEGLSSFFSRLEPHRMDAILVSASNVLGMKLSLERYLVKCADYMFDRWKREKPSNPIGYLISVFEHPEWLNVTSSH